MLPGTTGNCEPSQKRLGGRLSFSKATRERVGAVLPTVDTYSVDVSSWAPCLERSSSQRRAKALLSTSPSHTDVQKKADESYSRITCILPLTKYLSHPLEVTSQRRWVHPSSLKITFKIIKLGAQFPAPLVFSLNWLPHTFFQSAPQTSIKTHP